MLKRCLLAVIVALLVTSSQIAAAEDYDWSQAPRIGTKAELARYIENERRRVDTKHPLGQTEFHFVLTYLKVNNNPELVKLSKELGEGIAPAPTSNLFTPPQWGTGQYIYTITTEYPGTHVANAYLSRNQQQAWMNLNHEEQDLFNIAVGIVDEANKYPSEEEKAKHIYNRIREIAHYKSHTNPDAIGALVKKETNCAGFTDAFYMLGRMCNLQVGRINGTAIDSYGQWSGHGWNWITFSNGKSYCVDVTHGIFKATYEDVKNNHRCEWEIIPNLQ